MSECEDEGIDLTNITLGDLDSLVNEQPEFELKYLSDAVPNYDQWSLPLLMGYDVDGRVREWQISFVEPTLQIIHGLQDGKKQVDIREVHLNESGRDIYEQAWLEACQRYTRTVRKGYRMEGETDSNLFKVMRAQIYKSTSKLTFPTFYDFKMDGYRHYITCSQGKVQGYTREGSLRTNLSDLDSQLIKLFQYLPPGTILDTELYRHGMVFEEISSAIRTQLHHHQDLEKIQIHIFDACWDKIAPFEQRRHRLELAMEKFYQDHGVDYIKDGKPVIIKSRNNVGDSMEVKIGTHLIVEPDIRIRLSLGYVANSRKELDQAMEKSVRPLLDGHDLHRGINSRSGYEGIMIKRLSNGAKVESQEYKMCSYFYGKCAHIYKYKMIQDMEGICIAVEDSTGREKGCAMLKMIIPSGVTFMLKMDGSQDRRRQWLKNPRSIIGRMITFDYQRLSKDGIPMFAVGRRFRDDLSIRPYLKHIPSLPPKEAEVLEKLKHSGNKKTPRTSKIPRSSKRQTSIKDYLK